MTDTTDETAASKPNAQSGQPKTWLITVANSGFGRILTEKLLLRGDRVAATVRRPESLSDLSALYGDRLWIGALDLAEGPKVGEVIDRAFAELGRIDVIVSNAGYGVFGAAEEVSDEALVSVVEINLLGSIRLIRAALPHLRAQGGGRVLQVSSEGGQIAYPGFSVYHASKWGIEGYVEAVAQEVKPFGIQFTLVEPGASRTNFGTGIVRAEPLAVYDGTPVHDLWDAFAAGDWVIAGDPDRMVEAMIASADAAKAPMRLTLGADAYRNIRDRLGERIAELEAQKDTAVSSDFTAEELARM